MKMIMVLLLISQQALANDLPPGTYTIKNVYSGRYLKAITECFLNCCDLKLETSSSDESIKWVFEKAATTSYTIKSKLTSKVIDANALATSNDGCKVHCCNRLQVAAGKRTNQEWRLEKIANGNYRIRCVAGNKALRVSPDCANGNGCGFELYKPESSTTQQWVLQKVD